MSEASFLYQRHLTEGDEIRLIELQPGQKNDPLQATIQYRSLGEKPFYQALSYTWGSPFKAGPLSWYQSKSLKTKWSFYLDSERVEITDSLHSALIRIRNIDDSIDLWVDAVCIDQCHSGEKSWQIQKMREIYEKASQVLLWLGPSDETSDLAMLTLQAGYRYYLKTSPFMKPEDISYTPPPANDDQEFEDQLVVASLGQLFGMPIDSNVPIPEYPIKAVANLLNRAYWGRGWCWQEFTVATKISIMCGEHVLDDGDMCIQVFFETWDTLTRTLGRQPHELDHRPWSVMELRRSYRNIVYLKKMGFVDDGSHKTFNLAFKIWGFQNPRLTDEGKSNLQREAASKLSLKAMLRESSISRLQTNKDHREDQIFALLGMAIDEAQLEITVDCEIPWEEVYIQVAVTYLKLKDLWFLNHCQSGVGRLPARSPRLPSWVPDWSEGYRGTMINRPHSSPRGSHLGLLEPPSPPDLQEIEEHNRLRLRGILVDEVAWVSSETFPYSVNALATSARAAIYGWIKILNSQCSAFTRREIWTVLIADPTQLPMPDEYQEDLPDETLREYIDMAFSDILEDRDEYSGVRTKVIIEDFMRCFMEITALRCVFKTKGGRLALAHAGIEKTDRIAVFMGSETAFVMRPVALTSERPRYRILCECFVLGLMEDEGLKAKAVVDDIILE